MEVDRHNEELKKKVVLMMQEYTEARKQEESLLSQKAKVEWMKEGDRNTTFFHKILKERKDKRKIMSVCDESGNIYENDEVAEQFLKHFKDFLGEHDTVESMETYNEVFVNRLLTDETQFMVREVSDNELNVSVENQKGG